MVKKAKLLGREERKTRAHTHTLSHTNKKHQRALLGLGGVGASRFLECHKILLKEFEKELSHCASRVFPFKRGTPVRLLLTTAHWQWAKLDCTHALGIMAT